GPSTRLYHRCAFRSAPRRRSALRQPACVRGHRGLVPRGTANGACLAARPPHERWRAQRISRALRRRQQVCRVAMSGIFDLAVLRSSMEPSLIPGEFTYCSVAEERLGDYLPLRPLGMFREAEGLSLIMPAEAVAGMPGLTASAPMRCITLTVHSSLEAVGLTA